MDKIAKALKKFSGEEKEALKIILLKLKEQKFDSLDVKKLKGRNDVFRIRKGKLRVIYRVDEKENIFILKIERRNDKTYNF